MESLNQIVPVCFDTYVFIGRTGENKARTINFDVSGWQEFVDEDCTYTVVFSRPDGVIYPLTCSFDGQYVSVLITSTETAIAGNGAVEIRAQKGDVLIKSRKYQTRCLSSITGETEPPNPPGREWFERLLAEVNADGLTDNQIAAAIDRYLAEHPSSGAGQDGADGVGITSIAYQSTDANGGNVYAVTLSDGSAYTITAPRGAPGSNGADGKDGADGQNGTNGTNGVGIANIAKTSTSGLVDTYTITMSNGGTYTFTVTNGADGADGEGGSGGGDNIFVVNITGNYSNGYSADKTASEIYAAYSSGKRVVGMFCDSAVQSGYIEQDAAQFFTVSRDGAEVFLIEDSATQYFYSPLIPGTNIFPGSILTIDNGHNIVWGNRSTITTEIANSVIDTIDTALLNVLGDGDLDG